MKPINHYKRLFASAALLLALPYISFAEPADKEMTKHRCEQHHGFEHKKLGEIPPFLSNISLNNEQKNQIKTLMEAEKSQMQTMHQEREQLMREMFELSGENQLDESKAQKIAESLGNLEKEFALKRILSGNKLLSTLTPEQRAKALNNIKEHMQKAKFKPTSYSLYKQKVNSWIKS